MFVVLLKFSENKARASQFMDGHKAWIKRGFDDGVFLLAGNLGSDAILVQLVHSAPINLA